MSNNTMKEILASAGFGKMVDYVLLGVGSLISRCRDRQDLAKAVKEVLRFYMKNNSPELVVACLTDPAFLRALGKIVSGEPMDARVMDECISETRELFMDSSQIDVIVKHLRDEAALINKLPDRWKEGIRDDNRNLFLI